MDAEKRIEELERKLKLLMRENEEEPEDELFEPSFSLRKRLRSDFQETMRKCSWMTWGWLAFLIFMAVVSLMAFAVAPDIRSQLFFITFFHVMLGQTVLIKLWYWQVHTRVSITREVKRLEIQISKLSEQLSNP